MVGLTVVVPSGGNDPVRPLIATDRAPVVVQFSMLLSPSSIAGDVAENDSMLGWGMGVPVGVGGSVAVGMGVGVAAGPSVDIGVGVGVGVRVAIASGEGTAVVSGNGVSVGGG